MAVTSTGTTTATAQCTVNYATTAGSPHPITASYVNTDGNFTNSTSGTLSQVVSSSTHGTSTTLTSSPDPSGYGQSVTFTATVTKASGSGTPTGTVTFHLGSPSGTVVGTGTLNSSGKGATTSSSLPVGTDNLYAVYGGDTHFSGSTSPVRVQTVIGLPSVCASGGYGTYIFGNPGSRSSTGPTATTSSTPSVAATGSTAMEATTASTLVTGTTSSSTATGTTVCLRETAQMP